jgi:hypothetical protein
MPGLEAHRAVNLARVLQGLPMVATAPTPLTVAAGDAVTLTAGAGGLAPEYPLLVHVDATWTRTAAPGGSAHVLMVWAQPRQTVPGGVVAPQDYFWCGCVPIVRSVPVRIDGILTGKPLVLAGGVISLLVGLAELGLSPWVRIRCSLRNL